MTARIRQTLAAALASGLLLGAAGCSDNDDDVTGAPAATSEATPSAAASEEPSAEATASESPSATAGADGVTVTLDLVNGKPAERPDSVVKLEKGQTFTLIATSDKAYEIHIHGFDKSIDLEPGEEGKVSFVANETGSFVVEVEESGFELFTLQVS